MKPSNKTTTIQNRFITYTQSWWAKSAILLSFIVILFSCEEDLNFLGFKSNQQRFKVFYAEIPVTSSVLLMDSLRTSSLSGELTRIMVGEYVDPVFGAIRARAFSQFRPLSFPIIPSDAVYDSIVLSWKYDLYSYGSNDLTTQTIDIHEINEKLNFEDTYFYNRQVSISRVPIGTVGIRINPELFKNELEDSSPDTVITTKVRLSDGFGQRLFNSINPEDTLFTTPSYFSDKFKGLAILATQSDKIFGIDNFSENTVLTIYYHEGNTQKTIGFSLSNRVAFTQITGDRSGTDLTGLNTFYSEFNHPINRYIQNGTSIITKLDFSEFYKYMDTIPNITINSAELSITNVDPTDQFAPPGSLSLAMIKRNNRYKTITGSQDTLDFIAFRGSLIISDLNKLYAANDAGGLFTIPYSNTDHSYVGHPTLFAQRLFNLKQTEYPYWALVPVSPPIGKAVNRVVFPKDNIKLKIYYTRPILTENP